MIDWIATNKEDDSNIYNFQCSICQDSYKLHKNNEELLNDKCYLFKNANEISSIAIGEINDPNQEAYCKTCLDSWRESFTLLTGKPCKSPLNNLPMTFTSSLNNLELQLLGEGYDDFNKENEDRYILNDLFGFKVVIIRFPNGSAKKTLNFIVTCSLVQLILFSANKE
jgi:hypothetical protein